MLADASRRFGFLRCFCRGQALKQNNNKIPCSCRGSVMLLRRWMWDFLCYRAGQSVLVWAGETFIGRCQSDKDGIFQTGMVYSTQQNKVRNRIGTGGVKISRNHNRAGILESCIK